MCAMCDVCCVICGHACANRFGSHTFGDIPDEPQTDGQMVQELKVHVRGEPGGWSDEESVPEARDVVVP
jgi:hypothetical protein